MKNVFFTLFFLSSIFLQCQDQNNAVSEQDYLADLKEQMELEWPKNRVINVVFHGHSVPAGYFRTPHVNTLAAYPHLFLKYLKEQYPTATINVITTAIGGEQSEQGAKRFAEEVLTHQPDLLFIDYALNDRSIGLERSKIAWEQMIRSALSAGTKVVLLTPTPDLSEDISAEATPLAKHTKMIQELGTQWKIPVVNVYDRFKQMRAEGTQLSKYMSQGNHPNELGHMVVLLVIADTLFQH
ncbi:MAG: SGNH/GDSL hydrolase family protein [Bacteroidota bacterium]